MQGKILVVHRNELILDLIQEMLQDIGYAVTLVSDGHRALGKAMSSHYNLIIVNHSLDGGLDGIQLVERMRKYGVQSPIIGTAPDANWESPTTSSIVQVDYLLPSPFDYSELIGAVDSLLNKPKHSLEVNPDLPVDAIDTPDFALEAPSILPTSSTDDLEALLSDIAPVQDFTPPAPRPAPRPEMVRPATPSAVESPFKHSGAPRILLVDASDPIREEIAERFKAEGFDVTALKNGQDAYENTMLADYELILTDLWLPGLDGFELIDALRKSGVSTPIAVLTAHITRDMVQELLGYQICKILLKPLKPEDLLSLVQENVL
ncbi:MAG: response regulator [bacterium]|nr:response regulator [bacterium]